MLSIDSEYSLPSAATVWNISASTPANGPRPTHRMNITAQMIGSTERMMFKMVRTTK